MARSVNGRNPTKGRNQPRPRQATPRRGREKSAGSAAESTRGKASEPVSRSPRQVWVTRISIIVALLLVGEVVARILDSRVSEAANSVSGNVTDRIEAMRKTGSEAPCMDIAIVGGSLTFAGLDTQELAAVWPGDARPSTYNAALQSFTVDVWPRWIEDQVLPLLHPRNLILSLDNGLDWAGKSSTAVYNQDFDHLEVRAGRRAGGLGRYSALFRNRAALRQINIVLTRGNNSGAGFPGLTEWGTFPPLAQVPEFTSVSDGTVSPEAIDRYTEERIPDFDAEDGARALSESITAAQDRGTRVLLLDPPTMEITNLSPSLTEQRQTLLRQQREQLESIAKEHSATLIHLSEGLSDPKYWYQNHLNAWGSQRAIAELADQLQAAGVTADPACARSAIPTTSLYRPMPTGPTSKGSGE